MKTLFLLVFLSLSFGSSFSVAGMTPEDLKSEISSLYLEVPELKALQDLAQKHGVQIYAFGGTAGSIADFALRRQEFRSNPQAYLPDRMQAHLSNIIPPLKDIDIVIDGTLADLVAIENEILTLFPRYMPDGKKSAWEFRLLRSDYGVKEKLLGNQDMILQHSDSMSLTLLSFDDEANTLELKPLKPKSKGVLESLLSRELDYFFSDQHSQTSRYQKGLNPPILSVIRALTKVFEYELTLSEGDKQQMKSIIRAFDPLKLKDYPKYWIDNNAPKLFQNAKDIHRAFKVLEELGLKQKLTQIGSTQLEGSPAWWFSKEPLPQQKLTQGSGATAKELGITHVAHSTISYAYYQLLTANPSGKPNVFQSRTGVNGEHAVYGNGFYAVIGRQGAWTQQTSSAFDIIYKLQPQAREGQDFLKITGPSGEAWILIKNESAIIRESTQINIGLTDLVFGLLQIKQENQQSLPSIHSFKDLQGLIAERFSKSSGKEREFIEDSLIKNASFKWHLIPDFVKLAGGLSPEGQEKMAQHLIKSTSSGSIHERSLLKYPGFFTPNTLSKTTQEQIFETLFSADSRWPKNILPALYGSSEELHTRIAHAFKTKYFAGLINGDESMSMRKGFYLFLYLANYISLPDEMVFKFEEELFKSSTMGTHWKTFVPSLKKPFQKSALLEKRLSSLVQNDEWSLIGELVNEIIDTKNNELINFLSNHIAKVFRSHLERKAGSEYLFKILKKLHDQNISIDINSSEYMEYIVALHLNPLDRVADQSFSLGHSIVNKENLLTPYDHLYNWAREKDDFDFKKAFSLFKEWKAQLDFSQNPGVGTARPFGRLISKMGPSEKNEYKNYLENVVATSLKRSAWTRGDRFQGDYSTIRDFTELLIDSPLFIEFPESLRWIHELALKKRDYNADGNPVLEYEPSLSIVLDQIVNKKGPSGLLESLRFVRFNFTEFFDPLMQEILERTLLSPSMGDLRVLQAILSGWKQSGSPPHHEPRFRDLLKNALQADHWQKHELIRKHLSSDIQALLKGDFEIPVYSCKQVL